jgi:hypothetical protein
MGRPKELTEEERQELLAKGYKPVEVWVLDWDNPKVRERVERECQIIRESDLRTGELDYLDEVTSDLWDDFPR